MYRNGLAWVHIQISKRWTELLVALAGPTQKSVIFHRHNVKACACTLMKLKTEKVNKTKSNLGLAIPKVFQ